jgi:hypothetical protein
MKVGEILRESAAGTAFFILGYALGSLYDMLFFQLYRKIDPNMNSRIRLFVIVIVQLFLLVIVITSLSSGINLPGEELLFMRMGLISSQVFLLQWTLKRFVNRRPIEKETAKEPSGTQHDLIPY